jgi:hypothetical protein
MQFSKTVLFGLEVLLFYQLRFLFFLFRSANLSIFLEWALSTQPEFPPHMLTDAFLKNWADAQKFAYGMGAGWIVSHLFLFLYTPSLTS